MKKFLLLASINMSLLGMSSDTSLDTEWTSAKLSYVWHAGNHKSPILRDYIQEKMIEVSKKPACPVNSDSIDSSTQHLTAFVKANGWPTIAEFGYQTFIAAFQIAYQSNDPYLQKKCLQATRVAFEKELIKVSYYATILDRCLLNEKNGFQLFGTQHDAANKLQGYIDEEILSIINKNRRAFNLPSLEIDQKKIRPLSSYQKKPTHPVDATKNSFWQVKRSASH